MTAKEKANELVQECWNSVTMNANLVDYGRQRAKEGAMIAVNELIKEHTWKNPISWNLTREKYWHQVKTEIEKL